MDIPSKLILILFFFTVQLQHKRQATALAAAPIPMKMTLTDPKEFHLATSDRGLAHRAQLEQVSYKHLLFIKVLDDNIFSVLNCIDVLVYI